VHCAPLILEVSLPSSLSDLLASEAIEEGLKESLISSRNAYGSSADKSDGCAIEATSSRFLRLRFFATKDTLFNSIDWCHVRMNCCSITE
jgi:hypothetical protein